MKRVVACIVVALTVIVWGLSEGNCEAADSVQTVVGPVDLYRESQRNAGDSLFDTFSYLRLKKRDWSWSGAVSLYSPVGGGGGDSIFTFSGSVGVFVTDYVEIEGGMMWQGASSEDIGRFSLCANRHFGEWLNYVYPYVGAGLAQYFADESGLHALGKAGVRHYVTAHIGVKYWIEYDYDFDHKDGVILGFVGIFSHPY